MKTTEILQTDVVDELAFDPEVDSSGVAVTAAKDGIITLGGYVKTYAEKRAAERAALRVGGVKAVVNELEVELARRDEQSDEKLAQAAVDALHWASAVPDRELKVTVARGWITLEGEVEWQYQKKAAENAVHNLLGLRGVVNTITVKPRVTASAIEAKIEAAFKRSAEIDSDAVHVETVDGKVILRGTVRSWAEKQEAESAAWSAAGVTDVENHVQIRIPAYI